jgi:hypothetical protein
MSLEDGLFLQVAESWNLEKLYLDLNRAKQFNTVRDAKLSPIEKTILRGLLFGRSPKEIAGDLYWTTSSLSVELSKGLYRYVESLTAREPNSVKNWRDISLWLEEAGYKLSPKFSYLQDVPELDNFYNRTLELTTLQEWIVRDRYRLITIFGWAGIGKTALAIKFVRNFQQDFECIIWKNLFYNPVLEELLPEILNLLPQRPKIDNTLSLNQQIVQLIDYLKNHRCLLIFDGIDSILCSDRLAGFIRNEHRNYSHLLQRISREAHQSCLLLTSQDEPADMLLLKSNKVDSLQLKGLGESGKYIFEEKKLNYPYSWELLIKKYDGNPLALKLVASTIQELFNGKVDDFLSQSTELGVVIPDIFKEIFDQKFTYLSELEKKIICILASNRQPITWQQLQSYLPKTIYFSELTQILMTLKKRSLVEVIADRDSATFTLPSMVMKYVLREYKEECARSRLSS